MTLEQDYKGSIIHFAGYKITNEIEFDFLPNEYSRFKYGSKDIARKFGYDLANKFINEVFKNTYKGKQLVILPSAYSYIPTASFFMTKYFTQKLNAYLFENNLPVVQEAKIQRTVTYREDYGEMSAQDRYKLISKDTFYTDKEFLKDKQLIFLDDIKITGTHERIITKMLNEHNIVEDCYMIYFAELTNKEINPRIENYLNNYCIKNLNDVDAIIKNEEFSFNTRVVKYILSRNETEFDEFINKQTNSFKEKLYYNAIGNEFYKFEYYKINLNKLKLIL